MPRSRSTSRNSPNSITNISSPITTPEEFFNISSPPSGIHPNITVRDRTLINPGTPVYLSPFNENIMTPPHENVTVRERRPITPGAPRRRRALTMDDEDIYNTLLNLENDTNGSYSLLDSPVLIDDNDNYMSPSERYGINAAVPDSYDRYESYNIEGLSNKELDTHKSKIKIEKSQTVYDVIMMEETNIHDYINEHVDNIVFLYENTYYLSTKSRLSEIIDMTTTDNAIVFDCRGIGYQNVNADFPYVLINKLGIILNDFTNVISLENAIAVTKPTSGQYFIIKGTDDVLISTVTDNVLNGRYPNALGASHCQTGKSAIVFDIQKFKPEYISKSSKTRKRKSKSPMSKTKSKSKSPVSKTKSKSPMSKKSKI